MALSVLMGKSKRNEMIKKNQEAQKDEMILKVGLHIASNIKFSAQGSQLPILSKSSSHVGSVNAAATDTSTTNT